MKMVVFNAKKYQELYVTLHTLKSDYKFSIKPKISVTAQLVSM